MNPCNQTRGHLYLRMVRRYRACHCLTNDVAVTRCQYLLLDDPRLSRMCGPRDRPCRDIGTVVLKKILSLIVGRTSHPRRSNTEQSSNHFQGQFEDISRAKKVVPHGNSGWSHTSRPIENLGFCLHGNQAHGVVLMTHAIKRKIANNIFAVIILSS